MPKRSSDSRARAPTVLLVDDNVDSRDMYREALEYAEYRVEDAEDGEEGLSLALALVPAVVVLDLSMPVMDGYTLARELKKDERTRHIPLIACSAFADVDSKQRALAAGCEAFLSKPCLPGDLVTAVENALRKAAQRQA